MVRGIEPPCLIAPHYIPKGHDSTGPHYTHRLPGVTIQQTPLPGHNLWDPFSGTFSTDFELKGRTTNFPTHQRPQIKYYNQIGPRIT